MLRDTTAAVRKIATFIGHPGASNDDLIGKVVSNSSMESMKTGAGAINVRSGGAGKWRAMIQPGGELDLLFDDVYRQQMSSQDAWGVEFPRLDFDFGAA